MNHRERFIATMHYQPRDRAPLYDFNYWEETIPEWHKQGLPTTVTNANAREHFGLDCSLGGGAPPYWGAGWNCDLCPGFEGKILTDNGDEYTQLDGDGVIVRKQHGKVSIPMHIGHTLVDRESWQKHYLPRLDPNLPARQPKDWEAHVTAWGNPQRNHPVFLWGGSLFGRLRDWMGMENIALVVYDDPAWFEEMIEARLNLTLSSLEKLFATGARFEACGLWEDMAYNAGPLLAPEHFKRYLVPGYRRISELCRRNGCDVIWVDCDGKIDDLMPLWLDAGINCMFPLEIGTWGADAVKYRKQYGKDLLIMGGFDKHILARTQKEIAAEIHRLAPLVEEGGFIPFADHRVPPDVPLANYIFYCETARQVWGKNVNLEPMGAKQCIQ